MSEEIKEATSSTEQTEQISKTDENTEQTEEKEKETKNKSNIKAQIEEKLDTKQIAKEQPQNTDKKFNTNNDDILNLLLNSGFINGQQGQNLLNHIIRAALDNRVQQMSEDKTPVFDKNSAFKEFEKEKPDFFSQEGRSEILNYLKSEEIQFDKDELSKISKIVEQVEKSAIDRYLKKAAHEETLNKSNSEAKQRLKANAQNSNGGGKHKFPFTREQIGKMTSAEFLKYEKDIMDQLKKGLIK